jgi:AcrR family transcriptional regulator
MTMDGKSVDVKPRRRYDSSGRLAAARRSRAQVLAHARGRFLRDGYAATTVAAIATEAGVSVETVYKAFGGKAGLVRAICADALEGEGSTPAEERSDALASSEHDPRAVIRGWAALATEVAPRIVPVLLLVRTAAATDDEMAGLYADLEDTRLQRMTANAGRLARSGLLRPGVDGRHAGEVMWTYSSPELFELLVLRRGWAVAAYGDFIAEAMIAVLLPAPDGQ